MVISILLYGCTTWTLTTRQLHKNAASNLEQVLAATTHKTPTVRPPASSLTNQTCRTLLEKQGRTHKCWTRMDPTHGRAKAGRPARTYIQQLCEDTGCCPDVVQKTYLRRWTIGKSGERGSGISVLPAQHDDDDDSCCLSHHVFDQVNLWPALVGFETAIFWQKRGAIDNNYGSLISKWFQLKTIKILFAQVMLWTSYKIQTHIFLNFTYRSSGGIS